MTRNRWGTGALVMVMVDGALTLAFGVSAAFDTATPVSSRVLEATFGAGMGLFAMTLGLIAFGGRRTAEPQGSWAASWAAWWALWFLPAFFALHVALLGTWLPDAVLCALTVAALVLGRPRPTTVPAMPVPDRAAG